MRKRCILPLAATCLALFGGREASALCHLAARPFVMGQPGYVAMTVARESCRISLQAGGLSRYDSLRIVERPRGGRLVADGRTGVVFTPRPGFTGPDRFVFDLTGTSSIGSGTSRILVDVEVR